MPVGASELQCGSPPEDVAEHLMERTLFGRALMIIDFYRIPSISQYA
jgi:hypothetical protein